MPTERDQLAAFYEKMFEGGSMSRDQVLTRLAEFDALRATKQLPLYALLSTIVATISAIASAAAAYFAYAALHVPHS